MKKIAISVIGFVSLILILFGFIFGKNIMGNLKKADNNSYQRPKVSIIFPVYEVEKWLP